MRNEPDVSRHPNRAVGVRAIHLPTPSDSPLSRFGWALADAWTVARRDLIHWVRQPFGLTVGLTVGLLFPVMVLLMFGYLFGGADYREFLAPGMFAMTMTFGLEGTAMTEITTPILPCRSIDETLDFYAALGFEVTYRQKRPNTYAVVQRGGIALHFFVLRRLDPASSYGTCYVRTPDVDGLYQDFADGLRRAFGRLPSRGLPRIGALKDTSYGVRQFVVVDPGGNYIRIGQPLESADGWAHSGPSEASPTRLSKALHAATLLGDSKGDHAAASKVLDLALASDPSDPDGPVRVRALILRADLAMRMGDQHLAGRLLAETREIELGSDESEALGDDLRRARDLEQELALPGSESASERS